MTELETIPGLGIYPDRETPLEVKIEIFEGPLELLLHLIRKKKVSIDEVRLADLTAAYLSYIRSLQAVDLDIAGEFLEIAATLILIKSRTLLPRPPLTEEGEEVEDPEETLRRRLMEYQRFKDAAYAIGARDWLGRDVFPRGEEILKSQPKRQMRLVKIKVYLRGFLLLICWNPSNWLCNDVRKSISTKLNQKDTESKIESLIC